MRLQSASNGNVACQECGHGWEAASACRQHRCTQVRGIDMFWSWLFFFRTLTATPSRTFFDNAGWKRWTFKLVMQQSSSLSTHSATGTTMRKFYFQRFWVQPIWSLPRRCPARDSRSEGGALQIASGAFLGNGFSWNSVTLTSTHGRTSLTDVPSASSAPCTAQCWRLSCPRTSGPPMKRTGRREGVIF